MKLDKAVSTFGRSVHTDLNRERLTTENDAQSKKAVSALFEPLLLLRLTATCSASFLCPKTATAGDRLRRLQSNLNISLKILGEIFQASNGLLAH